MTRLSRLPYVLPLIFSVPQGIPHVVAVVGKLGADLRAVDADGTTLAETTVDGHSHPVHKVGGGGRSHRNIQSHADETVHHNIAKVAAETDQLVRGTGARLLILAGAVEPRALLRKALPDSCAQIAVEVESGGRTGGTDEQQFDREVKEQITQRWHEERDELLDRFHTALGRADGLAVQGIEPTTAALREANVESLLIGDPTLNDQTVWCGDRPEVVALDPGTLRAFGSANTTEDRADEALPAAALAVGADILATDEKLTDGVGVLLRHN